MSLRERFEFQAAAGTEYQYSSVVRYVLGQQDRRHALHRVVSGNNSGWSVGICCNGIRIGERIHGGVSPLSSDSMSPMLATRQQTGKEICR
ncbi:hypothetical protein MMAGJ_18230 [Mycolicibacterium mageritense]|uniref:Uncharacterized protein n=1 Tax=Mycolicibacterium mageritense TaxID=53462 RepID=A0ABM7HPS9_MYCME|nr:hypothetical protein MMAGJ_18230 [Mycolicibacterium mageritense]